MPNTVEDIAPTKPCPWRNTEIEIEGRKIPASEHVTFRARQATWCQACDQQTPESIAARTDVKQ